MAKLDFGFNTLKKVSKHVSIVFDTQKYTEKFEKTQEWLEHQVVEDMINYMPRDTGAFIENVIAENETHLGDGIITPYTGESGHYLYEGKAMVSSVTGSAWARSGETKVYSGEMLSYTNPMAQPHWFDVVKKNHWKSWVSGAIKEFRRD